MKITKVHLLFEQSGVFKNAFKSLGIPAFDYDFNDFFGQTDYKIDLFSEIDKSYDHRSTLFDSFSPDDLCFAFFPCTYFSGQNVIFFQRNANQHKNRSERYVSSFILERAEKRLLYYTTLVKLYSYFKETNKRLIIENPYTNSYLLHSFPPPSIIHQDRSSLGDRFQKPTAYWFLNIPVRSGSFISHSYSPVPIRRFHISGLPDSISRSLISPEYAINFIKFYLLNSNPKLSLIQDDLI